MKVLPPRALCPWSQRLRAGSSSKATRFNHARGELGSSVWLVFYEKFPSKKMQKVLRLTDTPLIDLAGCILNCILCFSLQAERKKALTIKIKEFTHSCS